VHPAIFLDRDGVIIENHANYVRSWEHVSFYPDILSTLARLREGPFKIVIVTNQAGVGKGLIPMAAAELINCQLMKTIELAGGRIDALLMCPHAPEDGCVCRKPNPGMILWAAELLSLDLTRSILIGDAMSDLKAGQSAGVRRLVLVRTGRGAEQSQLAQVENLGPYLTFGTVGEALANLAQTPGGLTSSLLPVVDQAFTTP